MSQSTSSASVYLQSLLVSISPALIGLLFSYVLQGPPTNTENTINLVPLLDSFTLFSILFYTSVAIGITIILYVILQRRQLALSRYMVSFLLSPIMFVVLNVLSQALLLIIFKSTTQYFLYALIAFFTISLTILGTVFILFDAVPPKIRNLFVLLYGSIFGTFLGYVQPTYSLLITFLTVSIMDVLLFRYSPVVKLVSENNSSAESASETERDYYLENFESDPHNYLRFQTKYFEMGIGDTLIFSALASHAYHNFTLPLILVTIASLFMGILITFYIAIRTKRIVPGLLFPVLLGVAPWIVLGVLSILFGM